MPVDISGQSALKSTTTTRNPSACPPSLKAGELEVSEEVMEEEMKAGRATNDGGEEGSRKRETDVGNMVGGSRWVSMSHA
eukprot:1641019-Pyramimonas_sp.AAC.1